ncbi:MAG: tyrosine-type recombinase/integrase [Acidimicrobiales bacterium]
MRDWAVRDYKRHVKTAKRWAPTSVNQALAAIDNFYRSVAAGRPEVLREELAQVAPRSLEEAEQRTFLRIVEASPSPRDRAMATVFFYAGLRLSELAALDMADVEMSARRGRLKVHTGKGDAYREVPLNSASRKALEEWFEAGAAQQRLP